MSQPRSVGRNVTFCNAAEPDMALGGLVQNGSITEANFLDILGILLVSTEGPLRVQERISSHIVERTDVPLKTGVYDIYCEGIIQVKDRFSHEVRHRDRKCVISGLLNPEILIQANSWTGFEAVHIFPTEHESLWIQSDYQRWITDMDDATGSSKINSPQNGFLLQRTVEQMFNQYLMSVNPDDGYKVVVFAIDFLHCDGRILDPACRNPADPHHVSDQLLRWHFRQSVLANVRGAGEPTFEHDFPLGTDMVGEILAVPYARERFELEIATRLEGVS
ncbi:hypothetical protein HOY80DRAFT_977166 [Tuber brumale]|nr:hypothetical protein HOY80DRAFT_977166 [Tuber brumale]